MEEIAGGIKEGQNCVGNYALKKDYDGSVSFLF